MDWTVYQATNDIVKVIWSKVLKPSKFSIIVVNEISVYGRYTAETDQVNFR